MLVTEAGMQPKVEPGVPQPPAGNTGGIAGAGSFFPGGSSYLLLSVHSNGWLA